MISFKTLQSANPHLRWTRQQLAQKIFTQAMASRNPIVIGGLTGVGKTELVHFRLGQVAKEHDIPLAQVNCTTSSGRWSDIQERIKRYETYSNIRMIDNKPAILVLEETGHISYQTEEDINIRNIISRAISRKWTPIFTLQSHMLSSVPFPCYSTVRSRLANNSLGITLKTYGRSESEPPTVHFLAGILKEELLSFIGHWFSTEGRSRCSLELQSADSDLADLTAKRDQLLAQIKDPEMLGQIYIQTGGMLVLISELLEHLWTGQL